MRVGITILAALLLSVPALATGSYFGGGGGIPDDAYDGTLPSMFASAVTVPAGEPGGDIIADIWLEIDMSHTWVGDLVIKLDGPAGLMTLMSRPGLDEAADDGTGCCGNSSDWVFGAVQTFDDDGIIAAEDIGLAGSPIAAQMLYPTGVYDGFSTPTTSLVGTYGATNAVGDWTLYIGDSAGGDVGTLESWTLHLTTTPEPASLILLAIGGLLLRRR